MDSPETTAAPVARQVRRTHHGPPARRLAPIIALLLAVAAPPLLAQAARVEREAPGMGFGDEQFTRVPEGSFTFGASGSPTARVVAISRPFLLQRTELTLQQWEQVMGPDSSKKVGLGEPVANVSWDDVQRFLAALNRREPGKNYRLPTEEEWEYAAKAGSENDYGIDGLASRGGTTAVTPALRAKLTARAWFGSIRVGVAEPSSTAVASQSPNAWRIYDMQGNLAEWVTRTTATATEATARYHRGGAWNSRAEQLRLTDAVAAPPGTRLGTVGFRLVRDLPAREAAPTGRAASRKMAYDPRIGVAACTPRSVAPPPGELDPERYPAISQSPRCPVAGRPVTFGTAGARSLAGYLSVPDGAVRYGPAIVLIPDSLGLDDRARALADRYAGEGYTVLAVDMYGQVPRTPLAARQLASATRRSPSVANQLLQQAVQYLDANGATEIAMVGYGTGGYWAFLAGQDPKNDIAATIMYYGSPLLPALRFDKRTVSFVGFFGGRQRLVTEAFMEEIAELNCGGEMPAPTYVHVFARAYDGFADPGSPRYRAPEAAYTWMLTTNEIFDRLRRW